MVTLLAFACLTTLARASSAIRYAASRHLLGKQLLVGLLLFHKLFIQVDLNGQCCSKLIAKD